jgi:hypothetical protein
VEYSQFSVGSVLSELVAPAAKAFWDERLRQMPCVFGRLAFLTSLRDPNTGTYRLAELEGRFGPEAVHRALRSTHLQAFWEWLEFSLEEKRADLALYLSMLPDHRRVVLQSWKQLQPHESFLPLLATEAERELYMSELDAILAVLREEYGVS